MSQELFLYERISRRLLEQIRAGSYAVGEKLPSVRHLSRLFGVSVNTVMQCYRQLEAEGYLEIRPQSGAFVRTAESESMPLPDDSRYPLLPVEVSLSEQVLHYMELHAQPEVVRLGIALPGPEVLPVPKVMQVMREVTRRQAREAWDYLHPNAHSPLTHQLARRSLTYEAPFAAEDIIVTNGCMEALTLALRSVSKPGDAVAVESPTYYGTLLLLEAHQRRVVEVPTHPREGISLSALEKVFAEGRVSACMVAPNAQNPLGFTMSPERKQALVALSARYQVPLIENDIWGDTVHHSEQALPAKAWDRQGLVIYCNSFSKTLMPGLRLGWAVGGRFHRRLLELKQLSTITSPSMSQLVMARLLESGFYAQHLRELRKVLQQQVQQMQDLVLSAFPAGTRVTRPTGGCVLWVRLPGGVDSARVFRLAAEAGIHVFPGGVFSATGEYRDYLRINAGNPMTSVLRHAVRQLGVMVAELATPMQRY
ncbi:transcriptional regulator [Alcanivorax sp. S71-1-4]|uniref:aminotransferase-like domain-containing protein n=1 Tax=Alcanivorax sp. S71-1-4 TaxID=1177159 RepID=UPI001356C107|nr:PLP-dependent aminotransferase family protein [Alcanivorax sp. S71-1-4]KAF0811219.1 transcriptional regulator [Alcanivorax sp. S71-1-4]